MKRVVIQYRVKPEHAEHNAELIRDVYEELERTQPDGLRYGSLRLADGVTFIHISEESDEGQSPLATLASTERFREGIAERCAEPPTRQETSEAWSYGSADSSSGAR